MESSTSAAVSQNTHHFEMSIPIVDCEKGILNSSSEIYSAIHDVGFVYLVNYGVSPNEVAKMMTASQKFFAMDNATKMKFEKKPGSIDTGFIGTGAETFNYGNVVELRETFNYTPTGPNQYIPDESRLPGFHSSMDVFYDRVLGVGLDVLRALATELGVVSLGGRPPALHSPIEAPEFFVSQHKGIRVSENTTTLRLLSYPPVPADADLGGVIRCGEHSDWGSITLLFQDAVGGLQVLGRNGEWADATPVPGSVLINTGDMLQRWSSDRLVATKHRVVARPSNSQARRQSLAFFMMPDEAATIVPTDGSDKYPPITTKKHLQDMFQWVFKAAAHE